MMGLHSEANRGRIVLSNDVPRAAQTAGERESQEVSPVPILDSTPEPLKKRCSKCGVEYPATSEYFSSRKDSLDGLRGQCKKCRCAYMAEENIKYPEKYQARRAAEYAKNREKQRVSHAAYRATHAEELRVKKAAWYAEHRDEQLARAAARRVGHEKEAYIYQVTYRATPEGKINRQASHQRRRARKNGNGGSYTPAELQAVLAAHTDAKGRLRCALCGKPITGKYHIDHWIPLSKGGANEVGNLRVLHGRCNLRKAAKLPQELGKLL